jgi:hypothetical protein
MAPAAQEMAMELSQRLTAMTDVELANLSANADRLGRSGTDRQRRDAAALLPLLDAEIQARKAAKTAEKLANRVVSAAPGTRRKRASPAVATAD